jgi:hypothetical protein
MGYSMTINNIEEIAKLLYEALKEAREHLEYCNYGDTWERECAREDKLPEKIKKAEEVYTNYMVK